ncbi:hypothetical protein Dsin_032971 [Dipteronia sinensis]|uniref:Berberine/berberine-like domain-containing protein n=1 Tax=Dipteronia sinensis TaxID=43782 RepID=A0AAE0DMJ9_9ROSI|nr:hypothetical protein Dsin_032971 [Dipteronia sinensis]
MVPSVSTTEPVITWDFIIVLRRGGSPTLAPFDAITPVSAESGNVAYPDLAEAGDTAADQPACYSSTKAHLFNGQSLRMEHHGRTADLRFVQFLTQFQGNYGNASFTSPMRKWAKEVEDLWNDGQPGVRHAAYVNYASGFEPASDWYGHEPWRLERLRKLKATYDPDNRFGYYCPIPLNSSST